MSEGDNVEALEKEMLAQAEEKAEAVIGRAGRIARRIARQASTRADEIRREAEAEIAPRREAETARELSLVDLELKRETAARRENLVVEALEAARDRLREWRGRPDADGVLRRLVREAVEILGGTRFTVEFAPPDEGAVADLAAELSGRAGSPVELKLERMDTETSGGVRVTSADGRSRVDQSFEARMRRLAGELRRMIHAEIFSDTGNGESGS